MGLSRLRHSGRMNDRGKNDENENIKTPKTKKETKPSNYRFCGSGQR